MTALRAFAAAAVVLSFVVAGCAGEQPREPSGHSDHSAGSTTDHEAGHGAGHTDHTELTALPDAAGWNLADATYLTDMIAHHSQAIDMTELAATRASDPRVRSIAESIDAGQGREVLVMADWLADRDLPVPTLEGLAAMGDMGMAGMLTGAQLDELAAAEGPTFDRLFLEDMIQHHQGAISMAEQQVGEGEDVAAVEWATEVIAGQQAEIGRMRDLLKVLP